VPLLTVVLRELLIEAVVVAVHLTELEVFLLQVETVVQELL
tara:strand:- start:45 stop:167 length:123 start_codon:yes stop_codon:yes gene_type:complete